MVTEKDRLERASVFNYREAGTCFLYLSIGECNYYEDQLPSRIFSGNKINILGEPKVGPESVVQKKECIEISQEATQDRNKRVRGGKNQKRKRLKKDTGKTTKKKKKGK